MVRMCRTTMFSPGTFAVYFNASPNGNFANLEARFVEFDDTARTNRQRGSGLLRIQDASAFTLDKYDRPVCVWVLGPERSGQSRGVGDIFERRGSYVDE